MAFLLVPLTLAWHYHGLYEVVGKFELDGYVYGWLWIYLWWAIHFFGIYWFIEAWFCLHRSRRLIGVTRFFFLFTRLLLGEERANDFWTVARSAEHSHWLGTLAITVPSYIMFLFSPYLLSLAFEVNIPFFEYVVLAISAMFVADLPVSFSGFGTTTMSWMIFFGAHGTPESIAALTLFMPFGRIMTHAFIGLIALKPGLDELRTLSISGLLKPGEQAAAVPAAVVPRGTPRLPREGGGRLVSRIRNSWSASPALLAGLGVAEPRNTPSIPAVRRLDPHENNAPVLTTNF